MWETVYGKGTLWDERPLKTRALHRGEYVEDVPVGLFLLIVRLQRARTASSRAMWRLLRDGSLIAAVSVATIGIVAVVAFEPLFLAFHYLFFPQGNFLFDPATSNLIRLYPDWYWEGISLRVGISFIAVSLGFVALAHARLRRAK